MGHETIKNKKGTSCLFVLVTGLGVDMGHFLPAANTETLGHPGFLPQLSGLCAPVLLSQLQTKPSLVRGHVFLANRMLTADKCTVCT